VDHPYFRRINGCCISLRGPCDDSREVIEGAQLDVNGKDLTSHECSEKEVNEGFAKTA
jgi:hypothetical protein